MTPFRSLFFASGLSENPDVLFYRVSLNRKKDKVIFSGKR